MENIIFLFYLFLPKMKDDWEQVATNIIFSK